MASPELLVARIRGEYREMPGLHLTFAQACRLWQLDAAVCEAVLEMLLLERFLVRTATGAFIALPMPEAEGIKPAKAAMEMTGTNCSVT